MRSASHWLLGVLLCLLLAVPASAEDGAPPAGGEIFENRIVVVTVKSVPDASEYLRNVTLEEIGGRMCVVGYGVDTGFEDGRWAVDALVLVSWEEILSMHCLTVEQYHELLELGDDAVIHHRAEGP